MISVRVRDWVGCHLYTQTKNVPFTLSFTNFIWRLENMILYNISIKKKNTKKCLFACGFSLAVAAVVRRLTIQQNNMVKWSENKSVHVLTQQYNYVYQALCSTTQRTEYFFIFFFAQHAHAHTHRSRPSNEALFMKSQCFFPCVRILNPWKLARPSFVHPLSFSVRWIYYFFFLHFFCGRA